MLKEVKTGTKRLNDYRGIIDDSLFREINSLAKKLQGLKVLHINATDSGGGVAEILQNLVPLMRNIGINAKWKIISADKSFFNITKSFHNALQGNHGEINRGIEKIYQKCNQNNACSLDNEWDIIVIHDPQPAAIPCYRNATKTKWIWRCHIDTSKPNKSIWKFFKNFFKEYDAAIFTIREFVPKDFPIKKVFFIPPAIDPLDIKNKPLSFNIAKKIIIKLQFSGSFQFFIIGIGALTNQLFWSVTIIAVIQNIYWIGIVILMYINYRKEAHATPQAN